MYNFKFVKFSKTSKIQKGPTIYLAAVSGSDLSDPKQFVVEGRIFVGVGFIRPAGLANADGLDKSSPYKKMNENVGVGFIRPE